MQLYGAKRGIVYILYKDDGATDKHWPRLVLD